MLESNIFIVHICEENRTLCAMVSPMSLTTLFASVGIPYGTSLPLIVLGLFVLITLPAFVHPGTRIPNIASAAYCYLAQMLGIILMSSGALPALYAVFSMQELSQMTYLGLLIIFGIGGFLFLWQDMQLQSMDGMARAVMGSLFVMTWKFIGLLTVVIGGLSFAMRLMLVTERTDHWWVTHLIMLLYGLILTWFTLDRTPAKHHHAPAKRVLIAHKRKK